MENFTVPDFISTNTLKDLSSKIRANKRERISEYLKEKKLLPNFKNIKKAKRALEVRISNEVLNPDYSNISAEKEFSNMVNFRERIEENVRTMLKINLNSRTEDELRAELKDVLQKIFDTYSGFVTVIDNQISLFDTTFVIKCLSKYKADGHEIDSRLDSIFGKTEDELDIDEETNLAEFFFENNDFIEFCMQQDAETDL